MKRLIVSALIVLPALLPGMAGAQIVSYSDMFSVPQVLSAFTDLEQRIASLQAEIATLRAQLLQLQGFASGFLNGERVQSTTNLKVRQGPSRNDGVLGLAPSGTTGIIHCELSGSVFPQPCPTGANDLTWWYIDWDSSSVPTGWSADGTSEGAFLVKAPSGSSQGSSSAGTSAGASAPFLSVVSPDTGPSGVSITLIGSGFTVFGNIVRFGGLVFPNLVSTDNGSTIAFTIPANIPTGNTNISVTNSSGTSNTVLFDVVGSFAGGTPPPPPPPAQAFTNSQLNQVQTNTGSITQTAVQGTLQVRATLNAQPWSGSIKVDYVGPATSFFNSPIAVGDYPNVPGGSHTFTYRSGGPANAAFQNINGAGSAATINVTNGSTATFTFNFTGAVTPPPPPPPPPADQGGTGVVKVKRVGADLTTASAPATLAGVDVASPTNSANPASFANISPGVRTIVVTDVPGFSESAGTCIDADLTNAEGCNVSSFQIVPACNGTTCSVSAQVLANLKTKVVVRYLAGGGTTPPPPPPPTAGAIKLLGVYGLFGFGQGGFVGGKVTLSCDKSQPGELGSACFEKVTQSAGNAVLIGSGFIVKAGYVNPYPNCPPEICFPEAQILRVNMVHIGPNITRPAAAFPIPCSTADASSIACAGRPAGNNQMIKLDLSGIPLGTHDIWVTNENGSSNHISFTKTAAPPPPPPPPEPPAYNGPATLSCPGDTEWSSSGRKPWFLESGGRYFLGLAGKKLKSDSVLEWKTSDGNTLTVSQPGTDPITLTHYGPGLTALNGGGYHNDPVERARSEKYGNYGHLIFSIETPASVVGQTHQIRVKSGGETTNWCSIKFKAPSNVPLVSAVSSAEVQTKSAASIDVWGNNFTSSMTLFYQSVFLSNNDAGCAAPFMACGTINPRSHGPLPFEFISPTHIRFNERNMPQSSVGGGPVGTYAIQFDEVPDARTQRQHPVAWPLNVQIFPVTPRLFVVENNFEDYDPRALPAPVSPPPPASSGAPTVASCSGVKSSNTNKVTWTANVTGGTGAYSYSWASNGTGGPLTCTNTADCPFSRNSWEYAYPPGSYAASVAVVDSSGQTASGSCGTVTIQ